MSFGGSPLCSRCSKPAYHAEQVIGPNRKIYHKQCLVCSNPNCGKRLDSNQMSEHAGEAYCRRCYGLMFGTRDLRSANSYSATTAPSPVRPSNIGSGASPSQSTTYTVSSNAHVGALGVHARAGDEESDTGDEVGSLDDLMARTTIHRQGGRKEAGQDDMVNSDGGDVIDYSASAGYQPFRVVPRSAVLGQGQGSEQRRDQDDTDEDEQEQEPVPLPLPLPAVKRPNGARPLPTPRGDGFTIPTSTSALTGKEYPQSQQRTQPMTMSMDVSSAVVRSNASASVSRPDPPTSSSGRPLGKTSYSGSSFQGLPASAVAPSSPCSTLRPSNTVDAVKSSPGPNSFRSRDGGGGGVGVGGSQPTTTTTTARMATSIPPGERCQGCAKRVYFAEGVNALGGRWHKPCLRCTACKSTVDPGSLLDRNGEPYCKSCYTKQFGPIGLLGKR